MRRAQLHQFVTDLIRRTWNNDNTDVAEAVLLDDAFGALCHHLHEAGAADSIERVWSELIETFDDDTLDFLADRADHPAAWLASQARELTTGTED